MKEKIRLSSITINITQNKKERTVRVLIAGGCLIIPIFFMLLLFPLSYFLLVFLSIFILLSVYSNNPQTIKESKLMLKKAKNNTYSSQKLTFVAAIFLPASIRETSLGDMEEIYKKDVKRFGAKKAKWLMFKDIVVSNYPIMKEFARKSAIKIIKFAGVYEAVRRIIG